MNRTKATWDFTQCWVMAALLTATLFSLVTGWPRAVDLISRITGDHLTPIEPQSAAGISLFYATAFWGLLTIRKNWESSRWASRVAQATVAVTAVVAEATLLAILLDPLNEGTTVTTTVILRDAAVVMVPAAILGFLATIVCKLTEKRTQHR